MLEDKSPQRTSLSQLGEFGLIDRLADGVKIYHKSTIKGIGDVIAKTIIAYLPELGSVSKRQIAALAGVAHYHP